MFNPSRKTHELLHSAVTRSHLPSFNFVKRVKKIYSDTIMNTQNNSPTFCDIRPFPSKRNIAHLQKTRLISFKISSNHSSIFDSPTLSFIILFQSNPTLSRCLVVGQVHSVFILIQLWFDSIYSPLISNFQLTLTLSSCTTSPSFFLGQLKISPPILRWPWSYPVALQFLNYIQS